MEQYAIKGGNPLVGDVEIAGAKNAALPIFAAATMTDETVYIDNIPDVRDIDMMLDAMANIGVTVKRTGRHSVMINGGNIHNLTVDDEGSKKIRGSYYLLGAFLGKYKHAEVVLPGGCDIGCRAIDQHLKGFRALGAEMVIEHGLIKARAEHLKGSHIYLDKPSVGATINIMIAAALADGMTTIENSAKEPHVVDVANFLNSCGANIRGAGTDVIRIRGVAKLHGTEYTIIPDQIEAGTFMFAAAVTKGDVTVKNVIPKHLESVTAKLLGGEGGGRQRPGGSGEASGALSGADASLSGIPYGHAAADHRCAGAGQGNQHRNREHFREPLQICGRIDQNGGGDQGRGRYRHHRRCCPIYGGKHHGAGSAGRGGSCDRCAGGGGIYHS